MGQTKRQFKKRLYEHLYSIRKPNSNQPLSEHFNQSGHPKVEALEIFVLKFIKQKPDSNEAIHQRNYHELQWIHRLKTTLPSGLNSMD